MRARFGALLVLMGFAIAGAQAPVTPAPAFEVASVKQNLSGRIGGAIQVLPAGQLSFTNVMLRVLSRDAYQVDPYAEPYMRDVCSAVKLSDGAVKFLSSRASVRRGAGASERLRADRVLVSPLPQEERRAHGPLQQEVEAS